MEKVKHDDEPPGGEQIADLAAVVLAARPERLMGPILSMESPEVRAGVQVVTEAVAALGLAADPLAPPASLRGRILASVQARRTRSDGARKALLVIDMIKEHLTPGNPLEVPRARAIVPALRERLAAARTSGVPVVYVVDEHDPDDDDMDGVEGWGTHAIRGGEGSDVWPEIAPAPGDRVVKKATYSAFTGSELAQVLDDLKVDTLVMTGCLTEIGVMSTATEALQRGFVVEIPPEAQAGASAIAEQVVLGILGLMPPYGPARRARLDLAAQAR
jgi:nicotinamidase-related amidase